MWIRTDREELGRWIELAFTSPRGHLGQVSSRVHLDLASFPAYLGVPEDHVLMLRSWHLCSYSAVLARPRHCASHDLARHRNGSKSSKLHETSWCFKLRETSRWFNSSEVRNASVWKWILHQHLCSVDHSGFMSVREPWSRRALESLE